MITEEVSLRKFSKSPSISCFFRSVACRWSVESIPKRSTVAFSKPDRALKAPRKTGEQAATFEN